MMNIFTEVVPTVIAAPFTGYAQPSAAYQFLDVVAPEVAGYDWTNVKAVQIPTSKGTAWVDFTPEQKTALASGMITLQQIYKSFADHLEHEPSLVGPKAEAAKQAMITLASENELRERQAQVATKKQETFENAAEDSFDFSEPRSIKKNSLRSTKRAGKSSASSTTSAAAKTVKASASSTSAGDKEKVEFVDKDWILEPHVSSNQVAAGTEGIVKAITKRLGPLEINTADGEILKLSPAGSKCQTKVTHFARVDVNTSHLFVEPQTVESVSLKDRADVKSISAAPETAETSEGSYPTMSNQSIGRSM